MISIIYYMYNNQGVDKKKKNLIIKVANYPTETSKAEYIIIC